MSVSSFRGHLSFIHNSSVNARNLGVGGWQGAGGEGAKPELEGQNTANQNDSPS